ncbi:type I-E CRISPR-associated protein Cas5/CasD [Saccharospirillum impatiens]|uniref:type I-E CRISPR-associated protein Cas5/CasD n=1 Tax=Saccharospirillum impatiens TaxID=169438 RepID=UPI00048F8C70|nr:type I-E CRISPR-associated protein Cas5/CasD [Saccharospirillum impatiens]
MEFLVFRLYGPLASWGNTAVGGVRPTLAMPTRSAILGMLGAALGIRRDEAERLEALASSFDVAVKAESQGVLLRDYHTSQVPTTDKKAIWHTRKDELGSNRERINTILSTRDYRADGHWVIALRSSSEASVSLSDLEKALKTPRYPLSLGRKSCPLAAPLHPRLVQAPGLQTALDTTFDAISESPGAQKALHRSEVIYQWEGEDSELKQEETFEQWDDPGSRQRWQFKKRTVHSSQVQRSA